MTTSTIGNIERYNLVRRMLIDWHGYNYSELFGLKLVQLESLYLTSCTPLPRKRDRLFNMLDRSFDYINRIMFWDR
jgi:hypothetical protein